MSQWLQIFVPTWALVILSVLMISRLNGMTIQQIVNRTGRPNHAIWYMRPGIFFHESAHAVVGRLFGLDVTAFSMKPDARADSAAHVQFRYDPRSVWAQVGLLLSSTAPIWVASMVLLSLSALTFLMPVNTLLDVAKVGTMLGNGHELGPLLTFRPGPFFLLLGVSFVLMPGMSLSSQDMRLAGRRVPIVIAISAAVFYGLLVFGPGLLIWWQLFNLLMGIADLVVIGIELVIFALVHL